MDPMYGRAIIRSSCSIDRPAPRSSRCYRPTPIGDEEDRIQIPAHHHRTFLPPSPNNPSDSDSHLSIDCIIIINNK
jgi:hypothetical protein